MLELFGCIKSPLSSYLKALGVLRLISEQLKDSSVKGCWGNNAFVLKTNLSRAEVIEFFLHDYKPTPIISPWNGSTGFYPKDNKKTIDAISKSKTARLSSYRQTISDALRVVTELKLVVQPKDKEEKRYLIEQLRNIVAEEVVEWIDACASITSDNLMFPPLTGTGGNDGNFEFSRSFMQQLQEVIDINTGKPNVTSELMLRASLFGDVVPGLKFNGKIGQFNPIAAGGANSAPGYDGDSRVNPWDYILMLEGIMLFTSGATRRYESSDSGTLAYPFTVRPSLVGYGSAAPEDARAELWAPIWSTFTSCKELKTIFNEGRAKVGKKTACDSIDFARAISSYGIKRGINEFIRYAFLVRNGLSYFALPVGRIVCEHNPQVNRIQDLDKNQWLTQLQRAASDDKAPESIKRSIRLLENALFEFSVRKKTLLDVLIALGEVEACLNRSHKFVKDKFLKPLVPMNKGWVYECYDESIEFRLALSLASRNLRPSLVWVRYDNEHRWHWTSNNDGITTWKNGASLENNLIDLLQREEIETEKSDKKRELTNENNSNILLANNKYKLYNVKLNDVAAWIWNQVDDKRIEQIARGLSLVDVNGAYLYKETIPSPNFPIPASYKVIKIVYHRYLDEEELQKVFAKSNFSSEMTELKRVSGAFRKLVAGDCVTAVDLAIRRLRASGFNPAISCGIYESPEVAKRIASSLAFVISGYDTALLLKQICTLESED